MDPVLANLRNATDISAHSIQLTLAEYTQLLDPYNRANSMSDIPPLPAGWKLIKFSNDQSSGFQAYAFYHEASNSLVIANTPTQLKPLDVRDIITDIQGAIPNMLSPAQLDRAIDFVDQLFGEYPAAGYSNIYFPSFSLSNALSMVQLHYAHSKGWLDGVNFSHVSMGSGFFGTDIDAALADRGVFIGAAEKQWANDNTTHYLDDNDVVTSTRFINGSEGEINVLPPLYQQDSLGGYHLVTDVQAHAGQAYIWRVRQMEALGINLENFATVVYAGADGKPTFKLVPKSDITLVIPSDLAANSLALLPEGFILDGSWKEVGASWVRGVSMSGDYVEVHSEDLDGDGVYDRVTKTYSNLLTRQTRETYSYRRYALSDGIGEDDYVLVGEVRVDANHNGVPERVQTVWTRGGLRVSVEKTHNEATGQDTFQDTVEFYGIDVSKIGSAFGSALGNVLFDDQLEQVLGSPVLQTIGGNLAEAVGFLAVGQSGVEAFRNAFSGFAAELGTNIAGSVSSYIVAEIIHAAGLDGTVVGDLGQSLAAQTLTTIITNIATQVPAFQGINLNLANIATIFATYVGTKLASKLVQFDSVEGQIGASLGATIGAAVGTSVALSWAAAAGKAGSVWGPIGAAIGAFVGYILGGLIGSMFAKKPQSGADVVWDQYGRKFAVGNVWTKAKAPRDSTRSLAEAVAANLNGALEYLGAKLLDPYAVRAGNYGINGKDFVYRVNGAITFRTRKADQLISFGTYFGLSSALPQLAGGDIHAKRALSGNLQMLASNPSGFSMDTLLGDLTIASDYSTYLSDPSGINALIAANPDSAFAAGWAATFARVLELGVDKRAASDWVGGFAVLFDELPDGELDGRALGPGNVVLNLKDRKERRYDVYDGNGVLVGGLGDTIDLTAKDSIVGGAGADTIVVDGDRLANASGLTVNGQAGAAGAFKIDVAAVIDGGAGDDFISGGDLGNDLLGGEGNDTLVGGKLDDWLFGEGGNDVLFAGKVANTGFSIGDLAAETAAVGADGGNGNLLHGGAGNDRLYGSKGSDWLRGGEGSDRLVGGAGGDVLEGGAGDDRGANGEATILGGAGSDIYLFGRGDGKDVIFDESDPAGTSGVSSDSIAWRVKQLENSPWGELDWAGRGDYEVDGSVKGGEDAVAFGIGISMANLLMRRSGNDLVIQLMAVRANGQSVLTGDELTIRDWFESTRRVEWLRFADGEEVRLGDLTSFAIGTAESDVILGSYGADFIYGGGGDDVIRGLSGNDFGNGGAGDDFVAGDGDNDWVLGGSGKDQVIGGSGHDTVFGDDGDDRAYGGQGSDLVVGGRGNDEVVGGAGDDVFRYSRGDGQDVVMDDYVNNWDLVWQNGNYVNGYVLQSNGTVTKNGVVYFDGSKWLGQYDWNDEQKILTRHAGAVNGVASADVGTDTLEFGVGIDIQDLMLGRSGNDLLVGIGEENDASGLEQTADRIKIKDWYALGAPIENFVFAATGRHRVSNMYLGGGTDGDDALAGTSGMDWLTGNGGDDTLDGGAGTDILAGNAGSDTLKGGADADVLYGGSGGDVLDGGAGADFLFGGEGIDIASYASAGNVPAFVYLDPGAAFANGHDAKGDVFDSIEGLQGTVRQDRLGGDAGDNVLIGSGGDDTLMGGAGDDVYQYDIGDGHDTIREGQYSVEELVTVDGQLNTQLFAAKWEYLGTALGSGEEQYRLTITRNGTGEVVYRSRDGIDFLYSTPVAPMPPPSAWPYAGFQPGVFYGRNTYNGQQMVREVFGAGEGGVDTVHIGAGLSLSSIISSMKNGSDLQLLLRANDGQSGGLTFTNHYLAGRAVEQLQFADGLVADLQTLRLAGAAATAGSDLMLGDLNANTLSGLDGNDVLSGSDGNDQLAGGSGDDVLEGGAGADTLDGGDDSVTLGQAAQAGAEYGDTIRYVTSDAAVTIDLAVSTAAGGYAAGDVLAKNANGVSTIENAVGSANFGDTLRGDERRNRLLGLGGDDWMHGAGGDDVLSGGDGVDTLFGGSGDDALSGDDGNDSLYGGDGKDLLAGGAGSDNLQGEGGDDQLSGDVGDDNLSGGAGNDVLGGQDGNDGMSGDAGDDKLAGGAGNDFLLGGAGADILAGDGGNDILEGGADNDTYLFGKDTGSDRIEDAEGANRIVIQDADSSTVWLQRVGNDLIVSVIGGYSTINLVGYYAADPTARMREIATANGSLFLGHAEPLIQAMTAASGGVPGTMPEGVRQLLAQYWHSIGKAVPTVADQTLTTNEDVPLSGQVGAVDHDDNIVSYTVVAQPGIGSVALNAATGTWTYTPGANRHGSDRFVIKVTDADGNAVQQTINLTVVSVNDAPSDIYAPGELRVDEAAGNGLSLGNFTHLDVDGPQDLGTFQLVDNAGGRFAMTSDGKLTVSNGAALDYEANTSHTIRVRVTDQAGAWFEKSFTVVVNNVNEVPYIVTPPATTVPLIASENATGGTVASFVIGDPDNTTPTLQLVDNPYGWLEAVGNTVRVKSGAQIDFEALAAAGATLEDTDGDGIKEIRFNASVRATDGELSSAQPTSFTFLIEDVNEAPTAIGFAPAVSSIVERDRPAAGTSLPAILLGTLSATDPDAAYGSLDFATLTYAVDDARFEIVNGNQLRLKANAALDFEAGATVTVNVTVTDRGGSGLSYTRALTFTVTDADDYLYGTASADALNGQAGRDLIYGYGGADTLLGGTGNDDLYGGDGNDQLDGQDGDDKLLGELGDDVLTGGLGNDTLHGNDGVDTLNGDAGNDLLYGDAGNDILRGGDGDDVLEGGADNDELWAGPGADYLKGGDGDDLMFGGSGADRFLGGAGSDTLTYADSGSAVVINLGDGTTGGAATGDVLEDHIEHLIGSAYADTFTGSANADHIVGGAGNDTILGGAGDDVLEGGDGNDTIDAQSGNDRLIGGTGNDILIGGEDSDVYLIDVNAGADEIRNYDANGDDIDVIGYQDIDRNRLWFARSGDDLVISVIGTGVQTTIKGWYLTATGSDRANYKIDFIIAGQHYSDTINAEGLVALMAGYAKPATQAAYDALHANAAFENRWSNYWAGNADPVISTVLDQTLAEDGTLTIQFTVSDDITPVSGMTVVATAGNDRVNAPTLSGPDANGVYTLTLKGAPNRSGDVTITLKATDAGGLVSQRSFVLDITPVADAPVITKAVAVGTTLDGGSLALDVQAALVDQDSSERLEVRISGLPSGLTLNKGTNLGNGVWSLTAAQLAGLALVGPATWSQDLNLTVTAIAKETASGQTAQRTATLSVPINARPTAITNDRTLAVNESTAGAVVASGTLVANFSATDPDGDALTFSLANNAGGRFKISTAGVLTVDNGSLLDREAGASHTIRIRITDAGGLTYEKDFTVTVNNVNEAPGTVTATMVLANGLGAENSALAGTALANLAAVDPDGTAPAFAITSDSRGWFEVVGNQLKFKAGLSFDFEALKAAGLTVSDIDGDGRQEVVYSAKVKATDGALGSAAETTVTVRIEDANDAPSDISTVGLAVNENAANTTLVGSFTGADQDAGDGLTFSLVNDAGGRFAVDATGRLTVKNGGLLNYEASTKHTITVRVTDESGAFKDKNFDVTVNNVNEAPTTPVVTAWGTRTIQEGAPGDLHVATLASADPDGTVPSLTDSFDPWDWFYVSGNQLRLRPGLNFDFDSLIQNGTDWWRSITDSDGDGQLEYNYAVGVSAGDGALGSPESAWVWFGIEDSNEGPSTWNQSFGVAESAPGAGQTLVGQFNFSDPDSQGYNRDHRFAITGGATGMFSINQTTGQIYLQGQLNYEAATSYQLQVTVTDRAGSGYSASSWVTINVANVNESPYFTVEHNRTYIASTSTFTLSAVDPEGTALSYTLISWSADWGTVTLNGNQLTIPASTRRYEPYYSYATVKVVDASGLESIRTFSFVAPRNQAGNPPVVLDLDGDGVELKALAGSTLRFDMDRDGVRDPSGWIGADDGLLVLDRDRNGLIDNGGEISFAGDKPGAVSDLEGLAAYDSNGNGLFDGGDARFGEFQIWQDRNQDGISQAQELSTLAARGIASIDLHGVWTGADYRNAEDNVLYATSRFTRADGSTGQVGDVFLAFTPSNQRVGPPDGNGTPEQVDRGRKNGGRGMEDDGFGDVASGRVDRRAHRDLTPAQILAMAMRDSALRESDAPERRSELQPATSAGGPQEPAYDAEQARQDERSGSRNGADERMHPADDYQPDTSLARSALHDQLALSEKKRFQMIEAMSSFSAQPYAEFGLGTGKDPKTVELLTALPDFRISR
ncbi:MAG TPA: cadherin domain-containing protein [Luteimonas sp.]|nr:cadherin domain-containing protein [Luteimonas sp.]